MPSADAILSQATAIANTWQTLAITWHVYLGVIVVGLIGGWRPSIRVMMRALVAPLVSVSAMAWAAGNVFNGSVFAVLAGILVAISFRAMTQPVHTSQPLVLWVGALLVAFGWVYPHFVDADSWAAYAYAAPFGLLPCPTLTVVIGLTLALGSLGSRPWNHMLVSAGLVYGLIGIVRLDVALDYALLIGAFALTVARVHR